MNFSLFNLLAQPDIEHPPYEWGDYFFPVQAAEGAAENDFIYWAILWISAVFFVLIVAFMMYFAWVYRRRPGHEKPLPSPSHNTTLEILWSVIPSILLVWMFYAGANGYFQSRIIPESAEEIWVTAQQFNWAFTYPDGDSTANELHLVVNRPVKFKMESRDVLHSLFIPAFRQKQDVVPGRYTYTWVRPTRVGTYRLYCTEYCGDNHSLMYANVIVHASEEARKEATKWDWDLFAQTDPVKNGERIYQLNCAGCHRVDGVRSTGPPLNEVYGTERSLLSGTRLGDENYIRESIREPNKEIVSGFTSPSQMPAFIQFNDDQLNWIVIYLKSLSGKE
ncbi:MAG TPA: cytochrome c oxidase subunit II [Pirellulaceae bacterium]|nr:cytochrome c oxidase subunit II [Pirellulaceae bacterium]HMO92255.1 cytochrome c oxidase subunit II [Pirellulaceae bacterium]HMP70071.1 cytochrome c oxidase subunit II [Pirellulaceae bacterium]